MPEFVSITLLPGLGMDVLQITAFLPGHGNVPLLLSPTVQQMADAGATPAGAVNDFRGALELPWSGNLTGLPSPLGTTMTVDWGGRSIPVDIDPQMQAGAAEGGLLRLRDATTAQPLVVPDGAGSKVFFSATDFDGHWFSQTETTVTVSLQASSIELKVVARNAGTDSEPVGIGWHPHFAIPAGSRGQMMLRLPGASRLEYDKTENVPTGRIVPLPPDLESFVAHSALLRGTEIHESLVHLKAAGRETGPFAELRDVSDGFGLRLWPLSPTVQEMRIDAPADGSYVALGPQTNLDDPLARSWSKDEAIATLQPGQSLEWSIRLEIFPASGDQPRH